MRRKSDNGRRKKNVVTVIKPAETMDFRKNVMRIANKAVGIMDEYFEGGRGGKEMVVEAMQMVREGVKVSNGDQTDRRVKTSQALKLISYIPKENREAYIALTNPEIKPFLLPRPKE